MDTQQLLDALTAHIALYHSSSSSSSSSHPSSNTNASPPRSSVLRWFAALSIPHRCAALTAVDADFTRLLLKMLSLLRSNGHGFFFLLPDVPSETLPTLLFRRSRGLLARAAAKDRNLLHISRSIRLFGSREGKNIDAGCLLDSITVAEDLVRDVDRFVDVMDGLSGGRFLRGEETSLGSAWFELPWLKDKGYYSMEEFVANKLEIMLRIAWMNAQGGRRQKGGKGKEVAGAAGVAANAFWRKKGCADWWDGLDPGERKNIFVAFLGKAARCLAVEIVQSPDIDMMNEDGVLNVEAEFPLGHGKTSPWQRSKQSLFNRSLEMCSDITAFSSTKKLVEVVDFLKKLVVIQGISAAFSAFLNREIKKDTLFFSILGSVNTVSEILLRNLRGLIMDVFIDYTNLELMGDVKVKGIQNKTEVKAVDSCQKRNKKCRKSKGLNAVTKPSKGFNSLMKPSEFQPTLQEASTDQGCGTVCVVLRSPSPCSHKDNLSMVENRVNSGDESPLTGCEMDSTRNLVDHKCLNKKKSGRKRAKNKVSNLKEPIKVQNSLIETKKSSRSSLAIDNEQANSVGPSALSIIGSKAGELSIGSNLSPNLCSFPVFNEVDSVVAAEDASSIQTDYLLHSTKSCCTDGSCGGCLRSNESATDDMFGHVLPSSRKNEIVSQNAFSVSARNPCTCSNNLIGDNVDSPSGKNLRIYTNVEISSSVAPLQELADAVVDKGPGDLSCGYICGTTSESVPSPKVMQAAMNGKKTLSDHGNGPKDQTFRHPSDGVSESTVHPKMLHAVMDDTSSLGKNNSSECYFYNRPHFMGSASYEWPNITPCHFSFGNSHHLPPATDRLHLDCGQKWPNHASPPFLPLRHQGRNSSVEGGCSRILPSLTLPMSFDWPPMVKSSSRLSQRVTAGYDSGYTPRLQSSFCSRFAAQQMQVNGTAIGNDQQLPWDIIDKYDSNNPNEMTDDTESHWMSEEEPDAHLYTGQDYNKFFGGGVMYWNTSEHVGTGFSRPPSYSSDDSAWAWHEADLNRAIDDMVGMSGVSGSYNAKGLGSPPSTPFCTPFDPLGPGNQSVSYCIGGDEVNGKVMQSSTSVAEFPEDISRSLGNSPACVEGMKADALPYPILRPIIVPKISRKGSRSEFKFNHDHKSPCMASNVRDPPRIKRPPSPVVLCVPRVPRPPPPSPVGESRKRGFPIVRSGSSSPRHWGVRSWHIDGTHPEESQLCLDGAELVWPSWGNKGPAAPSMVQSIQGTFLQDHVITISKLGRDQEHPDVVFPVQPPDFSNNACHNTSISVLHNVLHEEIESFCKKVAAENLTKKPYINWAVKRVTRSLQVLWPRSRTNIFGSNATGLALPTSDVDLVVSLPPVRNLEPIKEAGILEGRNGIKETCLQHAARYLANQEWVRNDSLKTIENTAIPVIILMVEVPRDVVSSNSMSSSIDKSEAQPIKVQAEEICDSHSDLPSSEINTWTVCSNMTYNDSKNVESIRLDISFKSPSHTGLQTSELVRKLTQKFPATIPLALVLKHFLAVRSLDQAYSGGLSSYCLVLLVTRFLQHEHHLGRPINQNLGSLLMDFLYFFGNVFDPRKMRISIQGSGLYMTRERVLSIDPIHIDDPLHPTNNVGRNCFRIHQCIKAFADAYTVLENELSRFSDECSATSTPSLKLLQKIIPSIDHAG